MSGQQPDIGKTALQAYAAAIGVDAEQGFKGERSFDARVRRELRYHTAQYWFVACLANGLLWMQILIGAALTALGATRTRGGQTAIIYLGAANTVIAGFLTYFKSRAQPLRARQYRQALRSVRNNIDEKAAELVGKPTADGKAAAEAIFKQYNDAIKDAEANYPDLWVSLKELRKFLLGSDNDLDEKDSSKPKLSGETPIVQPVTGAAVMSGAVAGPLSPASVQLPQPPPSSFPTQRMQQAGTAHPGTGRPRSAPAVETRSATEADNPRISGAAAGGQSRGRSHQRAASSSRSYTIGGHAAT